MASAQWKHNPLQWRHNERDGVSNHQHHDCLLNRLFRRRSKKTLKLRVTGLCAGNSPVTGEFPAQRASNVETVSIRWRHHAKAYTRQGDFRQRCLTVQSVLCLVTVTLLGARPSASTLHIRMMMTSWHGNAFRITGSLCSRGGHQWDSLHIGPVMRSFVFFEISLDNMVNKHSCCPWFETPWHSFDVTVMGPALERFKQGQ